MLVHPHERVPIARLLGFLEQGERVARQCADAQARLAADLGLPEGVPRFLRTQARQEAMHARVFQGAILWLAPRHLGGSPLLAPLNGYDRRLQDAMRRRDLAEMILAEQIILEGLGEAILSRIEEGLAKRGAAFGQLRRILLRQEQAHHAFGHRTLDRLFAGGLADPADLRRRAPDYLALTEAMVVTLADLFQDIDEDPMAWAADARPLLPTWLVNGET